MSTSENWVDDVKRQEAPLSPWAALGWVGFTFALLVLPVALWAVWRALL